jgi:hypothetical protein
MPEASTMDSTGAAGDRGRSGQIELLREFIPTPERVSQYLEMNIEEVMVQMKSVEGREELYTNLLEHQQDLQQLYPDFRPERLKQHIDLAGETLAQKERFLRDIESPEKKGMFRRAWDSVRGFAKKHPVVATALVAALIAGGVGGALYLSGTLQLAQAGVAAETVKEFIEGTDILNSGMGGMEGFHSLDGVPPGL